MGVPTPRESTFSVASSISCCETSLLSWVSWSGPSQLPERVATEAGEEGEAVLELEGAVVCVVARERCEPPPQGDLLDTKFLGLPLTQCLSQLRKMRLAMKRHMPAG